MSREKSGSRASTVSQLTISSQETRGPEFRATGISWHGYTRAVAVSSIVEYAQALLQLISYGKKEGRPDGKQRFLRQDPSIESIE